MAARERRRLAPDRTEEDHHGDHACDTDHRSGALERRVLARRHGLLDVFGQTGPVKKNIALLYGFSFFDQFMIVIALWVPYLTAQGISMRQFMELQA